MLIKTPAHVFYGGAHLVKPGLLEKLQRIALQALDRWVPEDQSLKARIGARLRTCPVEDLRIDFEDGLGARPEEEILQYAESITKLAAGTLPANWGIRTRPFGEPITRRILDRFLDSAPPPVIALPKVETPADVEPLVTCLDRRKAPVRVELVIETPAALNRLTDLMDAGHGRLSALHFGAYDFLSALDVTAPRQRLDHPFCDQARYALKMATAGTGIQLYDGVTSLLPMEPDPLPGWQLHQYNVTRAIDQGFYAGWDVHPAQIPARYAALYVYYDANKASVGARLKQYLQARQQATRVGAAFDDAATVRGLVRFLGRGLACGALAPDEIPALAGSGWAEIQGHA